MNDKIREMIIEEATAALREILPVMVREIAQKHFEEQENETLEKILEQEKGVLMRI